MMEFLPTEYEQRLEKVQMLMAESGLDALFLCSEPTFRYFTGHYTETWLNLARPMAVWIPQNGEPVAVVCDSEEDWMRECAWVSKIVCYSGLEPGAYTAMGAPELGYEERVAPAIAEAAGSIGISSGSRIGCEYGSRFRMNLSQRVIDEVKASISGAHWQDAAAVLWESFKVKSEAEIHYLRRAVESLDNAFPSLLSGVAPDSTEADVATTLRSAILNNGADRVGYLNVVGNINEKSLFSSPSDRKLQPGALMYVDGGAVCRGYWSDYCRLMAIGSASDEQKNAYAVGVRAMSAAISAAKPGNKACDIARSIFATIEDDLGKMTGDFGRVGHGIGLQMPEPPSLHVLDETVLEPGMVICLEPNFYAPGVGYLVMEEQIIIRDGNCELLSRRAPSELPIV